MIPINKLKAMMVEILKDHGSTTATKKPKTSTQSKPYYSDDDEDDDDDDDDDEDEDVNDNNDNDDDDDVLDSVNEGNSSHQNGNLQEKKQSLDSRFNKNYLDDERAVGSNANNDEDDCDTESKPIDLNTMTLIDLANFGSDAAHNSNRALENVSPTISNKQMGNSCTFSSASSSSTSPVSSPMPSTAANKKKPLNAQSDRQASSSTMISSPSGSGAKPPIKTSSNTSISNSASSKLTATSMIINHLINEETRQKPPANPFPVKHFNPNIAKNGLRLGLYK